MTVPIPEVARHFLGYDAESGAMTWIRRPGNRRRIGSAAGRRNRLGYLNIGLLGKPYQAHRIAWFLMTGEQPPDVIDHIDGDPTNNRWSNLRAATRALNNANRRKTRAGLKGVALLPHGRFQAQIKASGVNHYLGSFDTEEEAHQAYIAKAEELFGTFARAA